MAAVSYEQIGAVQIRLSTIPTRAATFSFGTGPTWASRFFSVRLAAIALVCALISIAPLAGSQSDGASVMGTQRLLGLARLWAAVKYFHPFLAYRPDIDWDATLLEVIPQVRAARTSKEYSAAIRTMLAKLEDPVTRIVDQRDPATMPLRPPSYSRTSDGIVVLSTGDHSTEPDFAALNQIAASAVADFDRVRGVIIDLRSRTALPPQWSGLTSIGLLQTNQFRNRLSSTSYFTPAQRTRTPVLLEALTVQLVADGQADFHVTEARPINPIPSARDVPIVFVVNAQSDIPLEALALQARGKAGVVAEGEVTESSRIMTTELALSEDIVARVRLGELVLEDGVHRFRADVVLPEAIQPTDSDAALVAARDLLGRLPEARSNPDRPPARGVYRTEQAFAADSDPGVEQRLLGAFRIWAAVNYLAPYKELIEENWDDILRAFIPRVEQAETPLGYHLLIAEMLTHIHDSHAVVQSAVLGDYFGTAAPAVRVRLIEGQPVITGFRDERAARAAGAEIGTVILAVDGEPAATRLDRYARYVSASTPQALGREAADREFPQARTGGFLYGAPDSIATVTVRTASGETKELRLPRKNEYSLVRSERSSAILQVLTGDIGYVDINRLTPALASEAFERFRNSPGIIFDGRGHPLGGGDLAARLTTRDVPTESLSYLVVPSPPGNIAGIVSTVQTSAKRLTTALNPYRGRTILLIDERTQSAGEGLGLALKAANNTTFIGSRTAGANGNMISLPATAGIVFSFTGMGIKHADGRQLQRVGLVPDVEVKETISGIQAGRDEVLDAALVHLRER